MLIEIDNLLTFAKALHQMHSPKLQAKSKNKSSSSSNVKTKIGVLLLPAKVFRANLLDPPTFEFDSVDQSTHIVAKLSVDDTPESTWENVRQQILAEYEIHFTQRKFT